MDSRASKTINPTNPTNSNDMESLVQQGVVEFCQKFSLQDSQFLSSGLKDSRMMMAMMMPGKSFRVSCSCDEFKETENYIGIMIYSINDQEFVQLKNGHKIRTGYVYMKNVKNLDAQDKKVSMHEQCARSLTGGEYSGSSIKGCGFAYKDKKWKLVSSTYNERFLMDVAPKLGIQNVGSTNLLPRNLGSMEQLILSRLVDHYMKGERGKTIEFMDCLGEMMQFVLPMMQLTNSKQQGAAAMSMVMDNFQNLNLFI